MARELQPPRTSQRYDIEHKWGVRGSGASPDWSGDWTHSSTLEDSCIPTPPGGSPGNTPSQASFTWNGMGVNTLLAKDDSGRNALHLACGRQEFDSVKALLEYGGWDLFCETNDSVTPFMQAIDNGYEWLVLLLQYLDRYGGGTETCLLPAIECRMKWLLSERQVREGLEGHITLHSYLQYTVVSYDRKHTPSVQRLHRAVESLLDYSHEDHIKTTARSLIDLLTFRIGHSCGQGTTECSDELNQMYQEDIQQLCRIFNERGYSEEIMYSLTEDTTEVFMIPSSLMYQQMLYMKEALSVLMRANPNLSQCVSVKEMLNGKIKEHFNLCVAWYLRDKNIPQKMFLLLCAMIQEILMHFSIPLEESVLPEYVLLPGPGSRVYLAYLDSVLAACSQQTFYRIVNDHQARTCSPHLGFDISHILALLDPKYGDYIKHVHGLRPPKLKQLCRMRAFTSLKTPRDLSVLTLDIPTQLQQYIVTTKLISWM